MQVHAFVCTCMHVCTHRPTLPDLPRLPEVPNLPRLRLPLDGGVVVLKHAQS